jgi:predicted dehydrogenase
MRTVVFGGGYWGANYIRELGSHCVLVVEPDEKQARAVADRFNVRTEPELGRFKDFDAAIIVTPPEFHANLAMPLLQQGKYVLVEKPLANSAQEARALATYPRCMAGHVYLWHPEVIKLYSNARPIDHVVTRRTNDGPVRTWCDALWDLAPHDISICCYLAGWSTPEVLSWVYKNKAVMNLCYTSWNAFVYVSWLGAPKKRLVEVVPTTGDRIVFDDLAVVLEEPPLTRMIKDFVSGEWDDRGSAAVGVQVVEVLENATRSVY